MILTIIIFALGMILILYFSERNKRIESEKKNKGLEIAAKELDGQAKMILKADLAATKVHEELDKKITGLYTLHELGKKISATFNTDDLAVLINQVLVSKLGFSKAVIAFKDASSGNITVKTTVGYSNNEIAQMQKNLNNKASLTVPLLKKAGFYW